MQIHYLNRLCKRFGQIVQEVIKKSLSAKPKNSNQMGPELFKFSDRSEVTQSESQKHELTESESPQVRFPIISLSENPTYSGDDQSVCIVTPCEDFNTVLRVCYMAVCWNRRAMQQNLLKLSLKLKQLSIGLKLQQCQGLKFQFLQELDVVRQLYTQLFKKWRELEECSVVQLVYRFPIADQILTCSLRAILAGHTGNQKLLDLNEPLDYRTVMEAFQASFHVDEGVIIPKQKVDSLRMWFSRSEMHLLHEIVTSKSQPTTLERTARSQLPTSELSAAMTEKRPQERKKLKLKPLHNVVFYSLLLQ